MSSPLLFLPIAVAGGLLFAVRCRPYARPPLCTLPVELPLRTSSSLLQKSPPLPHAQLGDVAAALLAAMGTTRHRRGANTIGNFVAIKDYFNLRKACRCEDN